MFCNMAELETTTHEQQESVKSQNATPCSKVSDMLTPWCVLNLDLTVHKPRRFAKNFIGTSNFQQIKEM